MSIKPASPETFEPLPAGRDPLGAAYFDARAAAIAKAYLRPEWAVADIGSGAGFFTAGLAPLVKRVYVVDDSTAMLDEARKALSRFANLEFHLADGARLPFEDETLDAAFANMCLHRQPDPLAAIREMARVLRPGGRLVITDLDAREPGWREAEMAGAWPCFERDQLRAWYKQAGLVNVIVESTGQPGREETGDAESAASLSGWVASGTRRVAMQAAVQVEYGAIARSTSSCGCGSAESDSACCGSAGDPGGCGTQEEARAVSIGYSPIELNAAPQEAAGIALGCGNPLAMAGLNPGEVVLDIGSGGGLDAFLAASRVGPGGLVIGVDMTPEMLARARATARRNQVANVTFRQGEAEALPVADGEIDVIISNCVINLTEDKGQVFREAFRALKPGGRLEVSDVVTSGPVPLEMQANASGWAECVTGALPEQEYLDLIAQAGFKEISTRRKTGATETAGISFYSLVVSARKPRHAETGQVTR